MKYYDICYRPVVFLLAAGSAICGVTVMSDVSQWDSYSEITRRLSGVVPAQVEQMTVERLDYPEFAVNFVQEDSVQN